MQGVPVPARCCSQEPGGVNRHVSAILICLSLAASLTTVGPAGFAQGSPSPSGPPWSDSFVSRVEALALIQTLNAEILASTSATTTLEKWCREHHLAENPQIVAHRTTGAEQPPTKEQRERLQPLTTSVSGTGAWSSPAETGSSQSRTTGMSRVA